MPKIRRKTPIRSARLHENPDGYSIYFFMITNGKVEGQTIGISSLSSSGNLIWFITGTSQGFGFELVRAAFGGLVAYLAGVSKCHQIRRRRSFRSACRGS